MDGIQEFKSQGHNDLAEYGGAAGAAVSVVTKSGTNQYHGALWEYLRNEVMDATGYFAKTLAPLRQNQYGATVGGPLSIPKLYNGKNRTFFFAAWENYKYRSASETGALAATDAMRSGDFSALGVTLYDPATTTYNAATNSYSRQTFTDEYNEGPGNPALCNGHINCIPQSRINPISAAYQKLIPAGGDTTANGANLFYPGRSTADQYSGTVRVDQNFGNNNQLMFRYSQFDLYKENPSGTIGNAFVHVPGHNYIGHWTHTFSPTAFSDVYFGRNYGYTYTGTVHAGEDAAFIGNLKSLGMSAFLTVLNGTDYAPQYTADGYVGLSGSQLQASGLADNWQFGGAFTKILGRHTIKAGADFETNSFTSPIAYSNIGFSATQTAGVGAAAGSGRQQLGVLAAWCSVRSRVPKHTRGGQRRLDQRDLRPGPVQGHEPSDHQPWFPQRHGHYADLWHRQGRELLHRRGQSGHRPVHPQRPSAGLFCDPGCALYSGGQLHRIEHAWSGRPSRACNHQPVNPGNQELAI